LKGDRPVDGPARRWMGWFLLWLAVSAAVVFVVYHLFPPTYDADALLRAEPFHLELFERASPMPDPTHFIEAQIAFIMSDPVLKEAIADSRVAMLPVIRQATSPIQAVRDRLTASNDGRTFFLRIGFHSEDPFEAATIVNAVTNSYLRSIGEYHEGTNANLRRSRESYLEEIEADLQKAQQELIQATRKLNRPIVKPPDSDPASPTSFGAMTDELYAKAAGRLLQADLELVEAESQAGAGDASTGKIAALKKLRSGLRQMLAGRESEAGYQVHAADLTRRIEVLSRNREELRRRMEEFRFTTSRDLQPIELIHAADVPKAPTDNPRFRLMLLAPVVVLAFLGFVASFQSWARRRAGRASGR